MGSPDEEPPKPPSPLTAALPDPSQIDADDTQCAICYEQIVEEEVARLPCCYNERSTLHYCKECMQIICTKSNGNYGRCPTCSSFLSYNAEEQQFIQALGVAQCRVCSQNRIIVEPRKRLCDACFLGVRRPLRYECERCHGFSVIPHPMWRYQATQNTFSTDTWFCRRCLDQTHWRLYALDIPHVPADDLPRSWGAREEFLSQVRLQSLEARGRARSDEKKFFVVVFVVLVAFLLSREFGVIDSVFSFLGHPLHHTS